LWRRLERKQLQVDGNGVALACADGAPIIADRKALLVILLDNLPQRIARQRDAGTIGGGDELVDLGPAVCVQREAMLLGLVAQDQADEFAEAYKLCVHMHLILDIVWG